MVIKRGIKLEKRNSQSGYLFDRAKKCIPGGVNSPVRAFRAVGGTPRFMQRAEGDRLYDVDGNEYIDYVCAFGPGILGHSIPRVVEALQRMCEKGFCFGAPTEQEVQLAELIAEMIPSIEVSRLVNSGTEAVMSAIRAARGFTGRDMIVKFRGCYHGHSDGLLVKAGSGAMTTSVPDSAGVPTGYTDYTKIAEYNDMAGVEKVFKENAGKIAAVIIEPVAANMGVVPPEDGFLEFLRDITKKDGALLIFDEVITGFRLSLGGAQSYYGVEPDITVLGKVVGGGIPIGVYGGRREIMNMVSPVGPVYQAGTLSGNPIATTAGIETLRLLRDNPEIYGKLDEKAGRIAKRTQIAGKGRVQVNRVGSLMTVFFTPYPVRTYEDAAASDTDSYARYFHFMLDHGIYLPPSQFEAMFVSEALTEQDLEKTCKCIEAFFEMETSSTE